MAEQKGPPPGKLLEEPDMDCSGPVPPAGGYEDSVFVELPPDSLACPVCLLVLKEPHLLSCCGAHICEVCILHVKSKGKPCPCCRDEDYTTLLNKRMRGIVYGLKVRCENRQCPWTGELGEMVRHTTLSCQYTEAVCRHGCGARYPRHLLQAHERDQCPNCPIEVRVTGLSKRLDCELKAVREKYDAEIASLKDTVKHQAALIEAMKGLQVEEMKQVKCELQRLLTELNALKETNGSEEKKLVTIKDKGEPEATPPAVDPPLPLATPTIWHTPTPITDLIVPPCVMILTDYAKHKQDRDVWYSPAFHSSQEGYRFCLAVHANGDNTGKDTHLSLYVVLMRGGNDSVLKWPFKGEFIVQLVNWREDASHFSSVIKFDEYTPKEWSRRLYDRERAVNGRGKHRFLAHNFLLYNAVKNTEYLKDDRLCLKLVKVKI